MRTPVELQTGRVIAFDHDRGMGEVITTTTTPTPTTTMTPTMTTTSGGAVYPFHCIEIADGSRHIEVGLDVMFELRPRLGRFEAAGLRPI